MNSDQPQSPENKPTQEENAQDNSENLEDLLLEQKSVAQTQEPEAELESESATRIASSASPEKEQLQQQLAQLQREIAQLQEQKQQLRREVSNLEANHNQLLNSQLSESKETIERMIQEGVRELEQRRQTLSIAVEQLERRRDRIREEMRSSFAGVSQDLAIRVQGFKDYLVGSLQDLAVAAEQLELPVYDEREAPKTERRKSQKSEEIITTPQFAEGKFQDQVRQIRDILDQYRTLPDYYGPPWQLRRTFEPIHAERVRGWFFSQGGRGAIKSMGSRLQNILIASAVISVLRNLYANRLRTLVLANTPERLGEWRRGLQDCLGISRSDFGPERGVVLFESPEAVIQKAERLLEEKKLPLIIIDETEDQINLSLLQFPLWLAFAPEPQPTSSYMY